MPKLFKFLKYNFFFWSNESDPLEPIHVHICEGAPQKDATKIWLLENGGVRLEHNKSNIPKKDLNRIYEFLIANYEDVHHKWVDFFGEISYKD